MNIIKNKVGGRPPKLDPANNRLTVNFTDMEYADFLSIFERSGEQSKATFIKARIFNKSFKVVKVDRGALDYCQQLSSLYNQYRAIGRNYNQTTLAIKRNFEESKALSMLYTLEHQTIQLLKLSQQIITLSEEFKRKYDSKNQL